MADGCLRQLRLTTDDWRLTTDAHRRPTSDVRRPGVASRPSLLPSFPSAFHSWSYAPKTPSVTAKSSRHNVSYRSAIADLRLRSRRSNPIMTETHADAKHAKHAYEKETNTPLVQFLSDIVSFCCTHCGATQQTRRSSLTPRQVSHSPDTSWSALSVKAEFRPTICPTLA